MLAEAWPPLAPATICATAGLLTAAVLIVNVAVLLPAGTMSSGIAGDATAGLLLVRCTRIPPAGACAVSVTAPVALDPPDTEPGAMLSDFTLIGCTSSVACAEEPR